MEFFLLIPLSELNLVIRFINELLDDIINGETAYRRFGGSDYFIAHETSL